MTQKQKAMFWAKTTFRNLPAKIYEEALVVGDYTYFENDNIIFSLYSDLTYHEKFILSATHYLDHKIKMKKLFNKYA